MINGGGRELFLNVLIFPLSCHFFKEANFKHKMELCVKAITGVSIFHQECRNKLTYHDLDNASNSYFSKRFNNEKMSFFPTHIVL